MRASPDDAAASDSPPRADVGPAAPSSPGSPGRRPPEDHPMSQHVPAHDETVRMPADGAVGRPQPDGGRPAVTTVSEERPPTTPAAAEEADDTRPVTRDWLLGAPDATAADAPATTDRPAPAERTATAPAVGPEQDYATETIDPVDIDDATGPTGLLPLSP